MDFRQPNITAATAEGQVRQMKDYLFQLTNQLNFALRSTVAQEIEYHNAHSGGLAGAAGTSEEKKALDTFYSLKNMIIKSAEIVDAYYEKIEKRLTGTYEALSEEYGKFKETTEGFIENTSEGMSQYYTSIQSIESDLYNADKPTEGMTLEEYEAMIAEKAAALGISVEEYKAMRRNEFRYNGCYIKTGWLNDDNNIAGVEIGFVSDDGTETDRAFAQFTTEELAFYDRDGVAEENKIAWFSRYQMVINNAKINNSLELGNYKIDTSKGITFKWIG